MIVLDTSVLSLAFRRRTELSTPPVLRLRRLIEQDAPLAIPGIVVQELLSGVRSDGEFTRLAGLLAPFSTLLAGTREHQDAARISNACRRRGISPSVADCLVAAQTITAEGTLLTTDGDFAVLSRHCSLRLLDIDEG